MASCKTDSSIYYITREYSQYLVVTKWEVTFKNYIIKKKSIKKYLPEAIVDCVMLVKLFNYVVTNHSCFPTYRKLIKRVSTSLKNAVTIYMFMYTPNVYPHFTSC